MDRRQILSEAERLAEEVLFPSALAVDASGAIPVSNLDRIASAGLYGLLGPTHLGGADADPATLLAVIELFAGACLTTCFVWTQHQGATRAVVASTGPVADCFGPGLSDGSIRSGVAFAHLLRAGPPAISAVACDEGWLISGVAPWVTGWGHIDVFHVAARHENDIVWGLIDAVPAPPSLVSKRLPLSAIDASGTDQILFDRHLVPADRVTSIQPYDAWRQQYPHGLRLNGSLSLGIASRAARLLGPSSFDDPLATARRYLDEADVSQLPDARGRVSALAVLIANSLVAKVGGRAVVSDHHGQRLAREAMFLLIQGQTPEIRDAQLRYLANPHAEL